MPLGYEECWEWFNMEQCLRKGCVLAPLLFSISFIAVLIIFLLRFREDPEILADVERIREPAAEGATEGPGWLESSLAKMPRGV